MAADDDAKLATVYWEQFKIGLNGKKIPMWTKHYNVIQNYDAFADPIRQILAAPIRATLSDLNEYPLGLEPLNSEEPVVE